MFTSSLLLKMPRQYLQFYTYGKECYRELLIDLLQD